jgi:hypothetical protein
MLESSGVVGLGILTILLMLRMIHRLRYLESFVVLCSWCRRVREGDEWVELERFLAARRAHTSHGLCPDCELRMLEELVSAPRSPGG